MFILQIIIFPSSNCSIGNAIYRLFDIEHCEYPYINAPDAIQFKLDELLRDRLFGQHLVHDVLVTQIYNHVRNLTPSQPLVLSFHGSPGSGKTFTSVLVMRALFKNGENSKFAKFFSASKEFPDPKMVPEYKINLTNWITETVKECPRSLFVFDEVDKMPAGLLDALVPLVMHPGNMLDGNDYKKAIYIFLGNAGGSFLNTVTRENWEANRKRKDLKLQQFEKVLSNEAFENTGGWYKAQLIEHILVTRFIPFLPMERRHVLQCIRRLAKDHTKFIFTDDDFEEMADEMVYWPEGTKQFSETGCKRVENIFNTEVAVREIQFNRIRQRIKSNEL